MENSSFEEQDSGSLSFSGIQALYSNGATSNAFKARIEGKWYFLKRPKEEFQNHPLYITAYEKEFDIGIGLSHPNIVRYLKKDIDDKGIYIQTEYIDGWTLSEFIDKNPHYFRYKDHVYKFTQQLLSALGYLHKRGILHLDLKPDNIMLTYIGLDVKLIDLGFAYSNGHLYESIGRTDRYAAPEQLSPKNDRINQCTDIYGFGSVLLYILEKTARKKIGVRIPQSFRDCAEQCLKHNPYERFQSIEKVQNFLKRKRLESKILMIFWISLPFVIFLVSALASSSNSYSVEPIHLPLIEEEVKAGTSFTTKFLYRVMGIIILIFIAFIINITLTKYKRKKNTINR